MTYNNTYIDSLIRDCRLAKSVTSQNESEGDSSSCFADMKNAVYVIEEVDGDINETYRRFCCYKEKKFRPCPKENRASQILYVGSSVGKLEGRLKQHIGRNENKSTSALNLSHWFRGKIRITAKTYDVSPRVLQIIEDNLHAQLQPAFGKKGGNGR